MSHQQTCPSFKKVTSSIPCSTKPLSLSCDVSMSDQQMFSTEERKCLCRICLHGPPTILQKESVAWTTIIRVAFYILHSLYPELSYLSMKTHVSPYILRHWQSLGIDKKGDNIKWKKHILDAIWHGDSFFESGTSVLKQTGVWRMINPKVDPWLDSPSSSPVPRRKSNSIKKARGSPIMFINEDVPMQQEFSTSDPASPPIAHHTLSASTPNALPSLPHISHLLRHVDDYWNSRSVNRSPPAHRRSLTNLYSPYHSSTVESRLGSSSPSSPVRASSPTIVVPSNSSPTMISLSPPMSALSLDMSLSSRSQGLPQIPLIFPSSPSRYRHMIQPYGTSCATDAAATRNAFVNSAHTRAPQTLPCISSLFQPDSLPSIFPTS